MENDEDKYNHLLYASYCRYTLKSKQVVYHLMFLWYHKAQFDSMCANSVHQLHKMACDFFKS